MTSRPRALALAAGSGIALGAAARLGIHVGTAAGWLLRLGGPWLLVPFLIGALLRAPRRAAAAGAVAMIAAVTTYYVLKVGVEHHATRRYGTEMIALWGTIGALAGAAFGVLGAFTRTLRGGGRAISVALVSGALAGEALLMLHTGQQPHVAQEADAIELVAAAALPLLFVRRARPTIAAIAMSIALALVSVHAVSSVRSFAVHAGWGVGHQLP
jgi:hypothetical protein